MYTPDRTLQLNHMLGVLSSVVEYRWGICVILRIRSPQLLFVMCAECTVRRMCVEIANMNGEKRIREKHL